MGWEWDVELPNRIRLGVSLCFCVFLHSVRGGLAWLGCDRRFSGGVAFLVFHVKPVLFFPQPPSRQEGRTELFLVVFIRYNHDFIHYGFYLLETLVSSRRYKVR